jgi:hypothetical protein
MAPTLRERVEGLEVAVAELIPREELSSRLGAAASAATEARDISMKIKVLLEEKLVAMVEEDHRTLRGTNGTPGLVADVASVRSWMANINRLGWWILLGLLSFGATLLWALLSHKIVIEEVVSKTVGG